MLNTGGEARMMPPHEMAAGKLQAMDYEAHTKSKRTCRAEGLL
jgi:hypothetical protein